MSIDDLLCYEHGKDKCDHKSEKLLEYYSKLNESGKKEAVKRVAELSINPLFRDMPIAPHPKYVIDKKELELLRQDIDEL